MTLPRPAIRRRLASLAIAGGLPLLLLGGHASAQRSGFPGGQATIEHILIHVDPGAAHAAFPVYRDLARAMSRDVLVTATVASDADVAGSRELLAAAGFEQRRVEIVVAHRSITPWARDRLIALRGPSSHLLTPSATCAGLDRLGDLESARLLATILPSTRVVPTKLWIEGGNVLFDRGRALVGGHFVAVQSLEEPGELLTASEAENLLQAYLGEVLLVAAQGETPHEHLDMFATVIGERTVLLGDPRSVVPFLADAEDNGFAGCLLPDFETWTAAEQSEMAPLYDDIAKQLADHGMTVHRVPVVHGTGGRVLTWNNALVEMRDGVRRAYVPVYGVPRLDDQALAAYRRAGCAAIPIDASRVVELGGAVRCLVNVVGWRSPDVDRAFEPGRPPTVPRIR